MSEKAKPTFSKEDIVDMLEKTVGNAGYVRQKFGQTSYWKVYIAGREFISVLGKSVWRTKMQAKSTLRSNLSSVFWEMAKTREVDNPASYTQRSGLSTDFFKYLEDNKILEFREIN